MTMKIGKLNGPFKTISENSDSNLELLSEELQGDILHQQFLGIQDEDEVIFEVKGKYVEQKGA